MMNHFNDNQVSSPNDSGGKTAFDNRQQSRYRNPQPISIRSNFNFKKPRFSERGSYPRIPLSVNRSKLCIPFKSELCLLYQKGKCHYGENCHFSHSISEIRNPRCSDVDTEEHVNEDGKRNAINKTKECRWFSSGTDCPYGDKCQYLHKCEQNVRRNVSLYRESYAMSTVNGWSDRSGSDQIRCRSLSASSEDSHKSFWKTKLCLKWERFGNCPYGETCTYAHGKAEIQELGFHSGMQHGCYTSRSTIASQPHHNAALCEVGKKIAKKLKLKGKTCFVKRDIEKISQIYADWMDDRHNFHISLSKVGS